MPGKGSAQERKMARTLSLWLSKGQHDDWLWRVMGSGGRATVRSKKMQQTVGQYGDICATSKEGCALTEVCVFEIKIGYGKWSCMDVLDAGEKAATPTIVTFIKQARRQAKEAGMKKNWILITKRDKRNELVFMSRVAFNALSKKLEYASPGYMFCLCKHLNVGCLRLDAFLKLPPEYVIDTFKFLKTGNV